MEGCCSIDVIVRKDKALEWRECLKEDYAETEGDLPANFCKVAKK